MSKSGIDTRSGLRKRSNSRPNRSGIEIGDGERIGDERARARTAARPDRDVVVLRPFDEVGHDQEVAGELHPLDDADLEGEPVAIILLGQARRRAVGGEALGEPLLRLALQLLALVERGGVRAGAEARQDRLAGRHARSTQRMAISTLACSASGRSANSSIICWRVLKSCCGDRRRRSSSETTRPSAMASSASCAS